MKWPVPGQAKTHSGSGLWIVRSLPWGCHLLPEEKMLCSRGFFNLSFIVWFELFFSSIPHYFYMSHCHVLGTILSYFFPIQLPSGWVSRQTEGDIMKAHKTVQVLCSLLSSHTTVSILIALLNFTNLSCKTSSGVRNQHLSSLHVNSIIYKDNEVLVQKHVLCGGSK